MIRLRQIDLAEEIEAQSVVVARLRGRLRDMRSVFTPKAIQLCGLLDEYEEAKDHLERLQAMAG